MTTSLTSHPDPTRGGSGGVPSGMDTAPGGSGGVPPIWDGAPGARVAVVVSGTVTDRLAPAVAAIVDACAERGLQRPAVISFGACASSGGPYWDSYAVTKGVDQLVEVDLFVPGCPPPPEALAAALDVVAGRVPA